MKGIMATLLALGLTGMVSGQQSQNNSNSFNNSFSQTAQSTSRSVMDSSGAQTNNSTGAPRGNGQPAAAPRLGPLDMVLDDKLIASFQRLGNLTADVQPVDAVNEIVFSYEDSHGHSSTGAIGLITPVAKENRTLIFEMSDADLQRIKNGGVRYKFDAFELGRYDLVKVFYLPPAAGQQQQPANFNSTRDSRRPFDSNFMGPTTETPADNFDLTPSNSRRDSNSQETFQRTQTPQSSPPSNPSPWSPIPSRGNQVTGRWDNSGNSFNDRSNINPQLDNRNNSSRFHREGDALAVDDFLPAPTNPNSRATDADQRSTRGMTELERMRQEVENRKNQALQQELLLEQQELANIEAANQQKLQANAARKQELDFQRLQTENQRRTSLSADADYQVANGFMPDRFANNSNRNYGDQLVGTSGSLSSREGINLVPQPTDSGQRGFPAAIPGPGNVNEGTGATNGRTSIGANLNQQNLLTDKNGLNMEGAMFFMLLCSLGLNIYLGWLSRGFYVRYSELADELRETFTATM